MDVYRSFYTSGPQSFEDMGRQLGCTCTVHRQLSRTTGLQANCISTPSGWTWLCSLPPTQQNYWTRGELHRNTQMAGRISTVCPQLRRTTWVGWIAEVYPAASCAVQFSASSAELLGSEQSVHACPCGWDMHVQFAQSPVVLVANS